MVVLGPERLPDVARKLGRFVGNLQRMFVGFQHEVQRQMQVVEQPLEQAKEAVSTEIQSLETSIKEHEQAIDFGIKPVITKLGEEE